MPRKKANKSTIEEVPKRSSFLPEPPKKEPPMVASTEEIAAVPSGKNTVPAIPRVTIKVEKKNEREVLVSLQIEPIEAREILHTLPYNAKPGQVAHHIAAQVMQLAHGLSSDALYYDKDLENQETEAKKRFARRA